MSDGLTGSWGSFSPEIAAEYLKTVGAPSLTSRDLLVRVLKRYARMRPVSILDLGCGNAQLYEYFRSSGLRCHYTGVDFSEPLLEVARRNHAGDPDATFVTGDVTTLAGVEGSFDVAMYSHVIEMLGDPERSLAAARTHAKRIVIRFFEPPEFETDCVELRTMDVGDADVPYIRRKMSRDHYRLILAHLGCRRVDVYPDDSSKDQVHVLHF